MSVSVAVTLEAVAAVVVILTGLGAFGVWAIRRLMELGAWIADNTAASQRQTQEMAGLRTDLSTTRAEFKIMFDDLGRRLSRVERITGDTNDKVSNGDSEK